MNDIYVGRRLNNSKRSSIIIDKNLGKYMPVRPSDVFGYFSQLDNRLSKYAGDKSLVIGFAETATALGHYVGIITNSLYIHTTRTKYNVDSVQFSESHSHASQHLLYLDSVEDIETIIFVDDELTTGNTILHLIDALEYKFKKKFKYVIVTLTNLMNLESELKLLDRGVTIEFLTRLTGESLKPLIGLKEDGLVYKPEIKGGKTFRDILFIDDMINARFLCNAIFTAYTYDVLVHQALKFFGIDSSKKVLVIGVEEFVLPGLSFASMLEAFGVDVMFQTTTRSPICVSKSQNYPLYSRYCIRNNIENYDTYLYNLESYDQVIILTDNDKYIADSGLLECLHNAGNTNIDLIDIAYSYDIEYSLQELNEEDEFNNDEIDF